MEFQPRYEIQSRCGEIEALVYYDEYGCRTDDCTYEAGDDSLMRELVRRASDGDAAARRLVRYFWSRHTPYDVGTPHGTPYVERWQSTLTRFSIAELNELAGLVSDEIGMRRGLLED